MEKESRLKDFLANPYKSMWKMAMPIIAGMMVQTLFNVVDIMFIGWLGADEVTAVAFVSPLFFIIIGLGCIHIKNIRRLHHYHHYPISFIGAQFCQ